MSFSCAGGLKSNQKVIGCLHLGHYNHNGHLLPGQLLL